MSSLWTAGVSYGGGPMRGRGSTILYVMRRQWCGATVIRWQEMEVELRMVDCQDIESHARGSIRHLNSPRRPTTVLSTELLFPFQCVQISSWAIAGGKWHSYTRGLPHGNLESRSSNVIGSFSLIHLNEPIILPLLDSNCHIWEALPMQ